ncbi:protein POF1B-like [Xyrauchen texanus]|uniref:protein POF1B-like n=1 Tax=Xyrauchen texanus TaxID=154827 RepID=UPI002241F9B8|nr:protein POF1B-like [Xyrauchen texanus]XP_051955585.1 protein POF1B-like [Xyrauchen texanus]XP_051955586.1 protein POF1B-like [Xyrauchen texanus]
MTLPYTQSVTTLKTVNVAEQSTPTFLSHTPVTMNEGTTTYRTVNLSGAQLQPVQYFNSAVDGNVVYGGAHAVNGNLVYGGGMNGNLVYGGSHGVDGNVVYGGSHGVDGNVMYGGARFLMPVQQRPAESYVYMNQAPRVVSPMYIQNIRPVSVSNLDETDVYRQVGFTEQTSSVFSQSSSPVKSPEHSEPELVEDTSFREEVVEVKNGFSTQMTTEVIEVEPVPKMDNRFFGELLAEVYRKNCDIHTCISEHVSKIRGRKHHLDPTNDYKVEKEEIEALIPKGGSELTKQQIRYLLQTRMTADKTMRLMLTTFSSLREELMHLQEDLKRLESEKEELENDLNFKADQVSEYNRLLEGVREHNRQLQTAVKDSNNARRTLESQLLMFQSKDPSKDFHIKELEGSKRALEEENDILRKKMAGQCSSSTVQIRTQELSKQYEQMMNDLREEKDRELKGLRSQLIKIQTEHTTITKTSDSSLELRITELLTKLEQHERVIRLKDEEIKRLKQQQQQQQQSDSSSSTSRTVVTKRYMNQYPILGLLDDNYKYTSPIKEDRTVVIERTGEITKRVI